MKITSLSELISLGKTKGALWQGVQFLVDNPSAMIPLIKQDLTLAKQYINMMTEANLQIIIKNHDRFFSQVYPLSYGTGVKQIQIDTHGLELNKDNISTYMKQISHQFEVKTVRDNSWDDDYYHYYYQGTFAFEVYTDNNFDNINRFDKATCELAYKSHLHATKVKNDIHDILNRILNNLNEEKILDKEFNPQSFLSSWNTCYLLDHLIENEDYILLRNIMRATSSEVLIVQLMKSQERKGLLLDLVDLLPKSLDVLDDIINDIINVREPFLSKFIVSLPSVFLPQLQQKSEDLAKKFLNNLPQDCRTKYFPDAKLHLQPSAPPAYENTQQDYLALLARNAELERQLAELQVSYNQNNSNNQNNGSSSTLKQYQRKF